MKLLLATLALFSGTQNWTQTFDLDKSNLDNTGRNPYFVLEPGYKLTYASKETQLVITVLDQTEQVDGVSTRVVEEREWKNGKLIEVSRNFFAIDRTTRDVYYFGEDVDMIQGDKVVSHDGAWRSGISGAKFGLAMPAKPTIGQAYYQEVAPKVAMDRAVIVGFVKVKTPAGTFEDCLKVEETTPLEPGAKGYKFYAPGVGLVQDSDAKLTSKPKSR